MKEYRIAVVAGDGIGPEVMAECKKVLNAAASLDGNFRFSFTDFPWGCEYYLKTGQMMPEDGIEILAEYDAILLGAVGYPGVPDNVSLRGLLIRIRHDFDQYINLRPVKLLKGAQCPLKDVKAEEIDMTFIRENTEGEYSGQGAWLYKGQPGEVVIQDSVFSRKGTERVIRYAYELARKEHKTLTSVSKANALNYSMVFWDSIFKEVGEEYPDVVTHSLLVDAASMFMVKDPGRFQIVVTSANLNPERKFPSMFEPIHGSAPDIAGQQIANPLAAIWSASQLLDFFGYEDLGMKILDTMEIMLTEHRDKLTPDQGGSAKTSECGDVFVELLVK